MINFATLLVARVRTCGGRIVVGLGGRESRGIISCGNHIGRVQLHLSKDPIANPGLLGRTRLGCGCLGHESLEGVLAANRLRRVPARRHLWNGARQGGRDDFQLQTWTEEMTGQMENSKRNQKLNSTEYGLGISMEEKASHSTEDGKQL